MPRSLYRILCVISSMLLREKIEKSLSGRHYEAIHSINSVSSCREKKDTEVHNLEEDKDGETHTIQSIEQEN